MNDDREKILEAESKPVASEDPPNNSGLTQQDQSLLRGNGDPSVEPPRASTSSMSLDLKATGPRTPQGKERGKYNALKHGLFARAVVLKNESRAEYRSLLAGLVKDFQPQGIMEGLLVEKLAVLLWRYRRSIEAETAEIQTATEFLDWDEKAMQEQRIEEMERSPFGFGNSLVRRDSLIRYKENPAVLARCLELLAELRLGVESEGFEYERAETILKRIYGDLDEERLHETLFESYEAWKNTFTVSEKERKLKGYASPAECKEYALQEIDSEIRRLKKFQKVRALIESERKKLEVVRRGVPDSDRLDRLLKREASLERAFDRTLSQLERLQRMRRGQPVPPQIDVKLSA